MGQACTAFVQATTFVLWQGRGQLLLLVFVEGQGEAEVRCQPGQEGIGDTLVSAVEDAGFEAKLIDRGQGQDTVLLKVGGMTCGACVSSVESAVQRLPGVLRVSVNLMGGTAEVCYNGNTTATHSFWGVASVAPLVVACDRPLDVACDGLFWKKGKGYVSAPAHKGSLTEAKKRIKRWLCCLVGSECEWLKQACSSALMNGFPVLNSLTCSTAGPVLAAALQVLKHDVEKVKPKQQSQ
eukprot:1158659-Pelagomonas_calceolata.AAC.4